MTDGKSNRRFGRKSALLVASILVALGGLPIYELYQAKSETDSVALLESRGWFVWHRGPTWLPEFVRDSMAVTTIGINGETEAADDSLGDAEVDAILSLRDLQSIHIFGGTSKWNRREEQQKMNLPFAEMKPQMQSSFIGKIRSQRPSISVVLKSRIPANELRQWIEDHKAKGSSN
jgi:hypothetical protein